MYGSHSRGISMALCSLVSWPARSSASCSARPFITVPSIPMWSDWVASMPDMAPVRPRQKLPPPTTTQTSTSMLADGDDLARRVFERRGVETLA